ncbi:MULTISPECIES: hypothetical protein [Bradyrhizobium]|uniref:Uncharacterized protein n=1 Tax=Bradyrhizobium barranii subsp. barranii TaxID=2823807 RepID=A0A939RX66_9BRAD|nr:MULTISPECIES: hypothetical protein [Bradyrhizobium]UEM14395.1 hypothetical protein J4G43_009135 [Bradyrhizobium barranii subsp. barranii]
MAQLRTGGSNIISGHHSLHLTAQFLTFNATAADAPPRRNGLRSRRDGFFARGGRLRSGIQRVRRCGAQGHQTALDIDPEREPRRDVVDAEVERFVALMDLVPFLRKREAATLASELE